MDNTHLDTYGGRTLTAVRQPEGRAPLGIWLYRRYLDAVRTFMSMRAERGERPAQVLGAGPGMWAHKLLDRLISVADDPKQCLRETRRLEECIQQMKEEEDD